MKNWKPVRIQVIEAEWLQEQKISLSILRLDEWHTVVSGNKWFKLQYYLKDAAARHCTTIATFGGAYSNHIVATAFACKEMKLQSIGIIRGERPEILSHTLQTAQAYGMKLQFTTREAYRQKDAIKATYNNVYWINEGGYGKPGALGAGDILSLVENIGNYTHIACATGTGTTLAGMISAALPHQTIIGFSALKNNWSLENEVRQLLSDEKKQKPFTIVHDYPFGGYAKHTPDLLAYLREVWQQHSLPLDFVYTGKAFYGLQDMIINKKIPGGSRILFIHTGGLQGNLSLPKQALPFS